MERFTGGCAEHGEGRDDEGDGSPTSKDSERGAGAPVACMWG